MRLILGLCAVTVATLILLISPQPYLRSASPERVFLPFASKPLPTPTPTLTPTATPQGTATPLPGTEITVSDNFEDPNSNWPVADRGGYASAYVDGEYEISVRWSDLTLGASNDTVVRFSDFRAAVDVRVVSSGGSPLLGIAFGIPANRWNLAYVCFVGNGYARFWRYDGYRLDPILSTVSRPPSDLWAGGAKSRLEVVRTGSQANCALNDVLVASLDALTASPGEVGLMVRTPSLTRNATARFDNYWATGRWAEMIPTPTSTPTSTPWPTSTSTPTRTATPTPYP